MIKDQPMTDQPTIRQNDLSHMKSTQQPSLAKKAESVDSKSAMNAHLQILPMYLLPVTRGVLKSASQVLLQVYMVAGGLCLHTFGEHRCSMLPEERTAATWSAVALVTTIVQNAQRAGWGGTSSNSYLIRAMVSFQTISLISKLVMASDIAVPVLVDPVTGCRVHLWRLVEWTVLAYGMTIVTEIVSAQNSNR